MTRLPALPRLGMPRMGGAPPYHLPEEEEQGLIRRLGGTALGGISAIGNLLDLPGSAARDLLAGENPIDQFFTPFRPDNRTTGRDLLRRYGLAGRRNTYGNFGTGLAAEIALDPLTYLTFGGSALTKAGRAAKAAGLLDDATRAARRASGVGPRQFRMTSTLEDVLSGAPSGLQALERAAAGMGTTVDALRGQRLGGSVGIGLPFGQSRAALNLPGGERIARGLDMAGEAIRFGRHSPVRHAMGMFGRGMQGATAESVQRALPALEDAAKQEVANVRGSLFDVLDAPEVQSHFDLDEIQRSFDLDAKGANRVLNERGNQVLDYLEGVKDVWEGPEELLPSLDRAKGLRDEILAIEQGAGLNTQQLDDIWADYWTRLRTRFPGEGSVFGGKRGARLQHGFQKQRLEFLKHIKGGTSVVQRLSVDPAVSGFAHTKSRGVGREGAQAIDAAVDAMEKPFPGGAPKLTKQELDSRVQYVRETYGQDLHLEADFNPSGITNKQLRDLTNWVAHLDPRHADLQIPAFQQNPLASIESRLDAGARAAAASKGLTRLLADQIVTADALPPGRGITATEMLNRMHGGKANDTAKNMLVSSLENVGNPAYQRALVEAEATGGEVLDNLRVPEDVARDVEQIMKGHASPKELNPLIEAYDKFLQHWKSSVTAWPSFHSRNLTSGQVQSMLADAWDTKSFGQSWRLLRGQEIQGLAKAVPAFKGMNDAQATRELRRLLFSHDVLDSRHGSHVLENSAQPTNRLPGMGGPVFSKPPAGATVGARINPLATETFEPFRISRDLGNLVEAQNRTVPFMNLLKKGWDPAEAAKRVNAIQVDYRSTAAADPAMRRLLPFWSFTRGVTPFVANELMERPGGRMGRTIMGINRSRDPSELTPDYVAETASVPLGELPGGSQRYLSGLGLMFEDPLGFISPDRPLQNLLFEGASRLGPIPKTIAEIATGQSLFQRGGIGGRPLEELDPAAGRLIANIGDLATGTQTRTASPLLGSRDLETILSNSPLARALTTARTLTDPRKLSAPAGLAANLLTGLRVTDVSPAAQDAILSERAQQAMKELGGRSFERVFIPADTLLNLPPEEKAQAIRFNALLSRIRERRQNRAQ